MKTNIPKLFDVRTLAAVYRDYKDVMFEWFFAGKLDYPSEFYDELIRDHDRTKPEDHKCAERAIDELFTCDEAAALLAFLNHEHPNDEHVIVAPVLPIPPNMTGISMSWVGDFCQLYRLPNYALSFQVEGLYDLRFCAPARRRQLFAPRFGAEGTADEY